MPEAVIIGQDEGTEIRVQALVQGGRRRLDVRVWRRGPSGFAPSRSGLILNVADLDALQQSIGDLLRVSHGGNEVARIVWNDDGRRLHAEIAPFGAHHVARFAFWQRSRNTWHAVDDGLVVSADRLPLLRQTLPRFRPWLAFPEGEGQQDGGEAGREGSGHWPPAGADWLTIGLDQVAFHPRSVRITAAWLRNESEPHIRLSQWRKEESLWVPMEQAVNLAAPDIESLLSALEALDQDRANDAAAQRDIVIDDVMLRLRSTSSGDVCLERKEEAGESFAAILVFPAEHLLRFGRFLLQSWSLLADRLAEQAWAEPDMEPAIDAGHAAPEALPAGESGAGDAGPNLDEGELDTEEPEPVEIVPLGIATIGDQRLIFSRRGASPEDTLVVEWEERTLEIPSRHCSEIVDGLRTLYYDALIGHRHMLVDEDIGIRAGVHNQGTVLMLMVEQGRGDDARALTIPGTAVPIFLDAVESALSHL